MHPVEIDPLLKKPAMVGVGCLGERGLSTNLARKNLQRPRYAHRKRRNGRPQRAVPDGPERFRYAPKRFALRAPLGLRCSALPHPERGERNTYTTQTEHKRRVQAHELTITHADRSRANKSGQLHVLRTVSHVAMEATGVYWRPVWAVLEGRFELMLVNPHHVKAMPGRKTDVKDCEWLADLLQHGLVRGSFVPPTDIQDLRDLTRYRA